MDLRLSAEEAEFLREVLEERHNELFREISRAQHHHFKTALRQKEALLNSVLNRLSTLLEDYSSSNLNLTLGGR